MTHSPMSQNRVRDALETEKDARKAFDAWMGKENASGFDHVKPMWLRVAAALTAPPPSDASGADGLAKKRLSDAIDGAIDKLRSCHHDVAADELDVAADNYLNAAPEEGERFHGWLFLNPDTGTEWSESHPIESGEAPDAEDIRPATLVALKEEMLSAWEVLSEARAAPADPAQAPSRPVDAGGVESARSIARILALHGLGTIDGRRRTTPDHWSESEWAERVLNCIPVHAEERCLEAAREVMAALATQAPATEDEPIRLMQIAQAAMARACIATPSIELRAVRQRAEAAIHAVLTGVGGKVDPSALATQAPDKAGAREGLEGALIEQLALQGFSPCPNGVEINLERADDKTCYIDTQAIAEALATQPTGTEASRPVGGESLRPLIEKEVREIRLWAESHESLETASDLDTVADNLEAALATTPTPPQADSTGQGDGVAAILAKYRPDIETAGDVVALSFEMSWHAREFAEAATPSQADAQTQEGGR